MTTPRTTELPATLSILTDGEGWKVTAMWHGAMRTVHTGTLFGCIAYVNANR